MKKNAVVTLLLIGSFVTLGLFQNCSKIAPQDLAKISGEAKVTANGENENIVNNDVIVEVSDLGQGPVVMQEQEDKKLPERTPSNHVIVADNKDIETAAARNKDKDPDVARTDDRYRGDDEKLEADDDEDDSKAIAACVKKKFRNSLTGSVFRDLHGKFEIVSDNIEIISNTQGKILVSSKSSQSMVRRISNHEGKLILCNLNVDLIEDGHGKIVLVNSKVKEILNHKGNVKSINSTIEKFSGRLKVVAF